MLRNTTSNINNNKYSVNSLNNQMSSQKKISRPSEDPVVAIRALRLRSNLSEINQYYEKNIPDADAWLNVTETALENISDNMLMGAVNAFNGETNKVWNRSTNTYGTVSGTAKLYKSEGIPSIVVAEENYGEGSSREHAAMEPRFLNVRAILAKSFARIHETNLKKQGMLALTFTDKADYDKIRERDLISVMGLKDFASGRTLKVVLHHEDGSKESFEVQHTYNEQQIAWFRAGSALNAR